MDNIELEVRQVIIEAMKAQLEFGYWTNRGYEFV